MSDTARGMIYVHSSPAALRPHIEWAIGAVLGRTLNLEWVAQPAQDGQWKAEYRWSGVSGSSAALASALRACKKIRFEVTEDLSAERSGERYCFTPSLGIYHATTNQVGDVVVNENQLRTAIALSTQSGRRLEDILDELLGRAWDDELEVFRYADFDDPGVVRWIDQVS